MTRTFTLGDPMRSTLIAAGATLAGIVVAFLMFGGGSSELPAVPTRAPAAAAPATPAAAERPLPPSPADVNKAFQERIKQPDAMTWGLQSSSWTIIRRELAQSTQPSAKELLTEASDLTRVLREARLRPDSADAGNLKLRQEQLRAKIEAAGLSQGLIAEQLARIEDLANGKGIETLARPATGGALGAPPAPGTTASGANNADDWGTPAGDGWGTPANADDWGTPANADDWGTPANADDWGTPSGGQK